MALTKDEADETQAKPSEVEVLISERQLKTLLAQTRSTKKEIEALTGDLREKIANAVENQHLDKKAFATLRQLDRMEPEKLHGYWHTLLVYMDMSGLMKRIESVKPMEFSPPEADDEGEEGQQPSSRRRSRAPAFPAPVADAAE